MNIFFLHFATAEWTSTLLLQPGKKTTLVIKMRAIHPKKLRPIRRRKLRQTDTASIQLFIALLRNKAILLDQLLDRISGCTGKLYNFH
jgi:hypothetical protein